MTNTAISIQHVTFRYKNSEKYALRNISLDIEEGDFILLVGYSGSGKSTLLKTINGLIPNFYNGTFGGKVLIFGEDITNTTIAQLAKKVGFVFQNPENQLTNLSVEREIAFPLENFGIPREKIIDRVNEIIQLMDLEKIRYKSPFSISGGEQQLTAIAAAIALNPNILILDEVTAHLAPKSANEILNKLYELNQNFKKTIILSEHRLDRCIKMVNKLAYIENGLLKVYGSINEVFENINYPFDMLPKIVRIYTQLKKNVISEKKFPEKTQIKFLEEKIPLSVDELLESLNK